MRRPSPLLAPIADHITGGRTLLRLATAGSVDDGKSTWWVDFCSTPIPCSPTPLIMLSR